MEKKKLVHGSLAANSQAIAVIMAGGSGTRFWPMSRQLKPKQFLPLAGENKSLIQATADRVYSLAGQNSVLVVTAENQAELVLSQLPDAAVLSEPVARNTAPCLAYAAIFVLQQVGDVPMLCLPADHVISGLEGVLQTYRKGIELARSSDVLVTFGIKPSRPETGYGYIWCGDTLNGSDFRDQAFQVRQFVEKPSQQRAEEYCRSGEYFWNSGMFVWRPSVLLKAVGKDLPELGERIERIGQVLGRQDGYELCSELYAGAAPISIDFGVLEKADNVVMVQGEDFTWSDVGSWSSWAELLEELDERRSTNLVRGDALLVNSEGCVVVGGKRLIAGAGLEDLIVVDTDDAILLCKRDNSQDVKTLVDQLKAQGRFDLL